MTVEKVYTPEIINVVNVFGSIVENVRAEYDSTNNEKPIYLHGHPLEIISTLQEYSKISSLKLKRFPMIALFEDFKGSDEEGIFLIKSKLNVFIITDTSSKYKASERYINSFDAVLTPIYNLLIKYIRESDLVFTQPSKPICTPINHLYWGKNGLYGNEGNVFTDFIDAIEIVDLDFKVFKY